RTPPAAGPPAAGGPTTARHRRRTGGPAITKRASSTQARSTEGLLSVDVARYGPPDDPNQYSDEEPTQYIQYNGYAGYEPDGPPPVPWYRKPAALLGLGSAGAIVIALALYGLVSLFSGNSSTEAPTTTSTTTATTATQAP